jgi:hypothetical protein
MWDSHVAHKTNRIEIHTSNSSVGIALGYGVDDRGPRVLFSVGAGNFSLHHRVQNGSGAHLASYPMGTRGSFPPSSDDVKRMSGAIPPVPQYAFMVWC